MIHGYFVIRFQKLLACISEISDLIWSMKSLKTPFMLQGVGFAYIVLFKLKMTSLILSRKRIGLWHVRNTNVQITRLNVPTKNVNGKSEA